MQIAPANKHADRRLSVTKFLPNLVLFLNNMRKYKIPIIHLQLMYNSDDPKAKELFGSLPPLLKGSEGVKLLPEILQPNDIIIEKSRDSGFFKTKLKSILKKLNVTSVIITGMQTYSCVQFTAVDAYFYGYEVIVNLEAVGSTRQEDTTHALNCMGKYCAKILSSNEIYSQLKQEGSIYDIK